MQSRDAKVTIFFCCIFSILSLSSCATYRSDNQEYASSEREMAPPDFAARVPQSIASTEKTVVVDPRVHAWGAYENGALVRAGQASAGSDWCSDLGHACHTHVGTFRVFSLGSPDCKSHIFPIGRGGAPMPYCMYFNGGQALHGVPDSEVGDGNFSHGCVRMHVGDAEWLRYNFVNVGTKVIVRPY